MLAASRNTLTRAPTVIFHRRAMATQATPSQIKGHARWIKGMASEVLGSVFSPSLRSSGKAAKASGIEEMRAAKEIADRRVESRLKKAKFPKALGMEGQGENLAGWALGCQGMKERGERKLQVASEKMGPGIGPSGPGNR